MHRRLRQQSSDEPLQPRHFDCRSRAHLGQSPHIACRPGKYVAGACKPDLVATADGGAPVAQRDAVPLGPIGNLARRNDRACILFGRQLYGDLEVNLLAPGEHRGRDRQRRSDGNSSASSVSVANWKRMRAIALSGRVIGMWLAPESWWGCIGPRRPAKPPAWSRALI